MVGPRYVTVQPLRESLYDPDNFTILGSVWEALVTKDDRDREAAGAAAAAPR